METGTIVSENTFMECCGSRVFAAEMAKCLPFSSLEQAIDTARFIWWNQVNVPGWLEAFAAHPRIGDVEAVRATSSSGKQWAGGEQSTALRTANDNLLQELALWNKRYEAKFGFIFLICATGKSSSEILAILKDRFLNRPIEEIQVAAEEQQKITELRLAKVKAWPSRQDSSRTIESTTGKVDCLASEDQVCAGNTGKERELIQTDAVMNTNPKPKVHQVPITTHVLDVSLGKPGVQIDVILERFMTTLDSIGDEQWTVIGSSVTNDDGRSGALMDPANHFEAGTYRLTFKTGDYLARRRSLAQKREADCAFYPYVYVVFEVKPYQLSQHFHIPLLLSPYSYTTYRGS